MMIKLLLLLSLCLQHAMLLTIAYNSTCSGNFLSEQVDIDDVEVDIGGSSILMIHDDDV